ncbi:MAG: hypothetical protein HQK54_17260, partial [Oligoflexales bacterium]|nr:hypothetical protein [Oligoflexales bacterium]
MINLGYYFLFLCFLVSIYGAVASLLSVVMRHRPLFVSAKYALVSVFVLTAMACAVLMYLLVTRDYSVLYVVKNTSDDLPLLYTITAFWSSLEGSHLLWTFFSAFMAGILVFGKWDALRADIAFIVAVLQFILVFMFYLSITYSDPFVPNVDSPLI